MTDIKVGDILENEDGLVGTIKAIDEENQTVVVEWKDAEENLTESTVALADIEDLVESPASDTLHPNSAPATNPDSNFSKLVAVIGALAKVEDISILDQVLAQIGTEAAPIPSGASAKNQASIAMKGAVKEEAMKMFEGQELSEDFKDKAYTLFEAAVESRVALEEARLEEEYKQAFAEAVEDFAEDMTDKIDEYMNFVVEKWMKDNEVAVESSLRNEMMESFINGLKNVFEEHYVDIPEEKIDVLEELTKKVEALEESLNGAIAENNTLKEQLVTKSKSEVVEQLSDGLAVINKEKFKKLSESIEFDGDLETFKKKLNVIKEQFFVEKKTVAAPNLNDSVEPLNESVGGTPEVRRYAEAISRTLKK